MKLSKRKHEILLSAIDDYIKDSCPITSAGVKKKQTLNLSTATLRNELSALEEMGFLKQIHTSGGRVPTANGYKYYVNYLMTTVTINQQSLFEVKKSLNQRTQSLSEIASAIATVISKATSYPTAVLIDGYDKLTVEAINIVSLIENKVLALIQTNSGYLNNTIDVVATERACKDASAYLTKLFKGKTIGFLSENIDLIKQGIEKQLLSFSNIVDSVIDTLKNLTSQKHLQIQHEHSKDMALSSRPEDMQKMLALLSDEEKVVSSLSDEDDSVFVEVEGDENSLTGLALVRAPVVLHGNQVAKIGVFGPERMNYPVVTQTLKIVIEELKGGENGKKKK